MIDYDAAVRDMMADENLAICFWTKEQCVKLRNAIIDAIGADYVECCGHIRRGAERGNAAFRLDRVGGRWCVNGGHHRTYEPTGGLWSRRFIEEYEVPDEEYEVPISFHGSTPFSLDILFGEVTA